MIRSGELGRPARPGWRSVRTLLAIIGVPVAFAACGVIGSGGIVTPSGETATETRQVSGFSVVEFSGHGDLTIEQTGTESLTITADKKFLSRLTSDVADGTLHLGVKPVTALMSANPVSYHLTVKDLTGLSISGSGNATATGISTPTLSCRVSGSGSVTLAGTADAQHLAISGSGRYQASELSGKTAQVTISGSGDATVNVSDTLDLDISGSGSVTYSGSPRVTQHVSGSGKVVHT